MYKLIKKCRVCESKKIYSFFDLGRHEPSNSLKNRLGDYIPKIPLKLLYCKNCQAVQLSAIANPSMLFSKYVWITGTSQGAKNYSKIFYSRMIKKFKKKKGLFVCEIASNDGTFLEVFKKNKHTVLGIDPAKNISKIANLRGIKTIVDFFNKKTSEKIVQKYKKADIVFARNVIPHVEKLHSIIDGLSNLVKEDGIVAIEFHYSKIIQQQLHYDSIYHEHLYYFSIKTLTTLFERYHLYDYDIDQSPISGGSLVIYFSKNKLNKTKNLIKFIKKERKEKINDLKSWKKFYVKSKFHSEKLLSIVQKLRKKNKIIGYGASARSSTLLNYSKINSSHLDFIIDKNPLKNNKLTAGTNIKIYLPKMIKTKIKKYKYCLLLAWNFKKEIIKELKKLKFVGKVLIPLPNKIKIYEIKKT